MCSVIAGIRTPCSCKPQKAEDQDSALRGNGWTAGGGRQHGRTSGKFIAGGREVAGWWQKYPHHRHDTGQDRVMAEQPAVTAFLHGGGMRRSRCSMFVMRIARDRHRRHGIDGKGLRDHRCGHGKPHGRYGQPGYPAGSSHAYHFRPCTVMQPSKRQKRSSHAIERAALWHAVALLRIQRRGIGEDHRPDKMDLYAVIRRRHGRRSSYSRSACFPPAWCRGQDRRVCR